MTEPLVVAVSLGRFALAWTSVVGVASGAVLSDHLAVGSAAAMTRR